MTALAAAGVSRVVTLAVAGAYHSRLMAGAAAGFGEVLAPVVLRRPPMGSSTEAISTESSYWDRLTEVRSTVSLWSITTLTRRRWGVSRSVGRPRRCAMVT